MLKLVWKWKLYDNNIIGGEKLIFFKCCSKYCYVIRKNDSISNVSPRKPRGIVLTWRRRRRRREQIGQWWKRFGRLKSPATTFALQLRWIFTDLGVWYTSVYFSVGLTLHFALVSTNVCDRHRYPIIDPREGLTVAKQQNLTNCLRKYKNSLI